MQNPRVAFLPIARTTFDTAYAREATAVAQALLAASPLTLGGPEDLITDLTQAEQAARTLAASPPDLLLVFQATFADSTMVMRLVEAADAPVLLWAIPEAHTGERLRLNSLCGINLAGHALTRAGYRYEHLFVAPDDPAALEKILPMARAGQARQALRTARLGRVGEHPDGFETCSYDAGVIEKIFGLQLEQLDLATEIFPRARQIDAARVDALQEQVAGAVTGLEALETRPVRGTLSVYAALHELAEARALSGFAVRCWPEFFTELGCAACGAMAMLSDQMVPCSCEADVNGTITQLLLQILSGEPAFGTDMVSVDDERDALVLWHCGLAPLSMADPEAPRQVTIHSNRRLPLLFEFPLKPGPVTLARLSQASDDYRLVVGRGEMVRAPRSFSGTSGLVTFNRPARQVLAQILEGGLEHHISLTYGEHTEALIAFAHIMDIPVLPLTP